MQSLISGAECATSNPLSQVLKHTENDRSLQRDKVGGPASSRLQHLPPSTTGSTNAADLAIARQFFDSVSQSGAGTLQGSALAAPREGFESLYRDPRPTALHTADIGPSFWNRPVNMPISSALANAKWSDEFSYVPAAGSAETATTHQVGDFHPMLPRPMNKYVQMHPPVFQSSFSSQLRHPSSMNWDQEFSRVDSKGKGKATHVDFEAAFARAAASVMTNKEDGRIIEERDGSEGIEDTFERAKISDSPQQIEDTGGMLSEFQKVWDRLRSSELPPPADDLAKWEAEFNHIMQSQRDDMDFEEDIQNAWQSGLGNYDEDLQSVEHVKFDDDGIPLLEPYKFEPSNLYIAEQTSHLTRAKQLLNQNGSLTEAALLLEAAIQKGELGEGGYEAWILLGETRSMDEREDAGMKALTEGVRRAQEVAQNGEGMLSLAVSYTNESFDRASHTILHRWLDARFPALVPEELKGPLPRSQWASHERATNAFLAVARQQHLQGHMEPDVQIGLGVLFYTNGEFDKAKDCFESALAARPKDYLLWNRLGSCLSNGSKPEEALGVYREALQLRPTYTRAIYNVGVACLNIGAHKEAAEHFLGALLMQESIGGDKSEQLWQTLRKCFLSMDRQDLAEAAMPGESLEMFRREGFEF